MEYTKEYAIRVVTDCAKKYRDELEGKMLLFVCLDKHSQVSVFEFVFYKRNYLHLTGLKVNKKRGKPHPGLEGAAAVDFYEKCLSHKLSPSDFEFAEDGTTPLKLDVLPSVLNKNLSAKMVGSADSARPLLYTERLAGSTKACVGFVRDNVSGLYVPNTVLKDDTRNNVSNYVRVVAVYRKNISDERYAELTYLAKKIDLTSITQSDVLKRMIT